MAELKHEVTVAELTNDLGIYLTQFRHNRRPRGKQVTLPLRVRGPMWPSILNALYQWYDGCLRLKMEQEIKEVLKRARGRLGKRAKL